MIVLVYLHCDRLTYGAKHVNMIYKMHDFMLAISSPGTFYNIQDPTSEKKYKYCTRLPIISNI